MSGYLASDSQNPDFVGAFNPDSRLSVTFYKRAIRNDYESDKQGKDVFLDIDYVKIFIPGDDKTVIDTYANETHKRRFPLQWAHYVNTNGGNKEFGTPISEWPGLTPAMVEELRYLKFTSVESIANASDSQIQSIGMLAGMSAHKFRENARKFLRKPNVTEEALNDLKQSHAEQIAELTRKIDALTQNSDKPKLGRPPKE